MARQNLRGHGHGSGLRLPREPLRKPLRNRSGDHRRALVRATLLRFDEDGEQGWDAGGSQWPLSAGGCAARSTPASPPKKDWNRRSIPWTRSARRVAPTSRANAMKAGGRLVPGMTTAATPAATWSDPRSPGYWRISRPARWTEWWATRATRPPR